MEVIKTAFLMVVLMLIFIFIGNLIGGQQGMVIAFLIAVVTNFISYFFSDKMVLKHYNAIEVNESQAPGLYAIVRRLSTKAKMPMPKVYIIKEEVPNAFATGRSPNHAAVAVNEGLLNLMSDEEVEAVLGHELSHVRHYDILTGSVVATFAGAIAMLANFAQYGAMFGGNRTDDSGNRNNGILMLIVAIVMPIVATIIQMAVSRSREYNADEGSAYLTGHPEWLISALQKLDDYSKNYTMNNVTPQTSHMFIINPLNGVQGAISSMFRTHPSTQDRIKRLEEIKEKLNNNQ